MSGELRSVRVALDFETADTGFAYFAVGEAERDGADPEIGLGLSLGRWAEFGNPTTIKVTVER